jgi:LmbE family N-acetylglucosaminyl deacetylase
MLPNPKSRILGENMRWIYLSPHFDDVVLSCGGLVWEQTHGGIPVEIWTVMAGDPPVGAESSLAQQMHADWQTKNSQETVAIRRGEDQNAARRVGAAIRHLSVPDAIYRRSKTGTLYYPEGIFVPPNPRESDLVDEIARQVSENLTQYDTIVCPLAIGGHVDHILTRKAVEALGRPLWYYADVPYVFRYPEELSPATAGMTGKNFFISAQGLAGWQESIAAHASQVTSLFANVTDMRQKIKEYAQNSNGLTLWERE